MLDQVTEAHRGTALATLQRRLAAMIPSGIPLAQRPLELLAAAPEPPRLISAEIIERGTMQARPVAGEPLAAFSAFLDGTQASSVLAYVDGHPVIHGTVAAVVRERRSRRLSTWRSPLVRAAIYAPRRMMSDSANAALDGLGVPIIDTDVSDTVHPFVVRDAAIHLVQKERERAEKELAEIWCGLKSEPLFIDGGISGSERVATSTCAIGVIKSHRTLYADGDALRVVLGLEEGQRSSVFRVTSPKRTTVASWYLRLRDPAGHDPLWGLVRVEASLPARVDEPQVGARADLVSRWILAETAPLALPDSRWDTMVYPIRDCEEYLRAIV